MKLTHLLLAALVALPLGLAGCDASGPDAASGLATKPTPEASGGTAKSLDRIVGPATITLGDTERYSMYGATLMRVKNLSGTGTVTDEHYSPEESYIDVRGDAPGNIQIQGYDPQEGWFYREVVILDPNADPCGDDVGTVTGPTEIRINTTEEYVATCATRIRVAASSQGSATVLSEVSSVDPSGRPVITSTIRGTAVGQLRLRAKRTVNGSVAQGPLRLVDVVPPPQPACDQTVTTVNGITGPNAVPVGDQATYYAYNATGMNLKNLSGELQMVYGYPSGQTFYGFYRGVREGNAQITATFGGGIPRARTVDICPAP